MAHTPQAEAPILVRIVPLRAKPVTERADTARHLETCSPAEHRRFVELLSEYGTRAKVARSWGVTPPVVDKVRDGRAPLSPARIAALPPSLRRALEAAAANDVSPLDAA